MNVRQKQLIHILVRTVTTSFLSLTIWSPFHQQHVQIIELPVRTMNMSVLVYL